MDSFKGKSVVVGYTSARDAGFQTTEQMLVNTPLTGSGPTNINGISSTWLVAIAIENLTTGQNLRPVPELVTLMQTAVVALACGLSWEFGSSVAAITTLVIWLLLISLHSALYRWASVSIPLSDTFLATVLTSLFAATRRVNVEINNMAEQQANASAKSEIAQIQSQFLSGFSQWLSKLTDSITGLIQNSEKSSPHDSKTTDLYLRANLAGADFKEYLTALSQLSQLESISPSKLVRQTIDLESLVATIVRRFETKSHERHIAFETLIATEARELTSVPNFIDAILFNFVSNAVKYSPDHTTIQIRIELGSSGETILSVIDQGPGIAPEFHQRIFERFYRINDDQLYSARGTGLGLYLCRYFAECLGGRVEVISEPGSGSEFRAVIP
jgi:signal transduction histidine kinase